MLTSLERVFRDAGIPHVDPTNLLGSLNSEMSEPVSEDNVVLDQVANMLPHDLELLGMINSDANELISEDTSQTMSLAESFLDLRPSSGRLDPVATISNFLPNGNEMFLPHMEIVQGRHRRPYCTCLSSCYDLVLAHPCCAITLTTVFATVVVSLIIHLSRIL